MNALVPSAPAAVSPQVTGLIAELEAARKRGDRRVEVSKFVGFDRDGQPSYPKITLVAEMGSYGQPVASVKVQQTQSNWNDFVGTLRDLDVRTACEYYLRLGSAEAVDAVEKVLRAPTPKAWALITLLDRMAQLNDTKEIEQK